MLSRTALLLCVLSYSGEPALAACDAKLEVLKESEAAARYESISRLAPDLATEYQNTGVSLLVEPGLMFPYRLALINRSGGWSAEYTSYDEGKPAAAPKTLPMGTKVIGLDSRLARHVFDTWHRAIEQPITSNSQEMILDGTSFLIGAGGSWAHTYSPSCGVPRALVDSGDTLRRAIRAKAEGERNLELKHLEVLLRSIDAQLANRTIEK